MRRIGATSAIFGWTALVFACMGMLMLNGSIFIKCATAQEKPKKPKEDQGLTSPTLGF